MAVTRVVPIIRVTDIRSAIEFYCSTLGFVADFSYSASPDGPVYAGVSLEGHQVHLSTFAGDGVTGSACRSELGHARVLREGSGRKHPEVWQPDLTAWLTSSVQPARPICPRNY
jgi:catechol 2,3-dioxygenase-like lactoylglutathione lyase family enzyme